MGIQNNRSFYQFWIASTSGIITKLLYLYIGILDSKSIDKVINLMEGNSLVKVLEALADSKSLEIFNSIAKGEGRSDSLKETKGLSTKQYYVRMKYLMNAGLVSRVKGRFSLTTFGVVVYHAQSIMEAGINFYWKLKAIDSIQGSGQIGEVERLKLVKTIIGDSTIENILVKHTL